MWFLIDFFGYLCLLAWHMFSTPRARLDNTFHGEQLNQIHLSHTSVVSSAELQAKSSGSQYVLILARDAAPHTRLHLLLGNRCDL